MPHRLSDPEVRSFQEIQLTRLRAMSFSELSKLPRSRRIPTPSHIRGLEFWIERRVGESGGVRVEARACRRSMFIFLSCDCPGFEMLSDGSIVPEPHVEPED